jgi:glutathione S-transferase|tara:strand:+ start:141 stop:749 length:609 start_codon:yes stop_codon:yes gene_type:complete
MRARLALAYSGIDYEHREILLKNRPDELYALSPKGTVPVLQLNDGTVIDESIDVMKWALAQSDPDCWYTDKIVEQNSLIAQNDDEYKKRLDMYKYHERFPEGSYDEFQNAVGEILKVYELILSKSSYLCGDNVTLADMALFPFIRQGAHVDLAWFNAQFPILSKWLKIFNESELFMSIMKKYTLWETGENGIIIQKFYTRNE